MIFTIRVWKASLLVVFAFAANAWECPVEFSKYDDFCYRFFSEEKTWSEAEAYCNQFHTNNGTKGQLASIHNAEENSFISTLTALGSGHGSDGVGPFTWIGLHRIDDVQFAWSDGTPLDYQLWHPGEPNSVGETYCVNTNQAGQRDKWDDEPCATNEPFVCKITSFNPTFWTSYSGSLYRFYSDKTTWDKANTICESDSAHLVIIDDSDENDFVSTLTASSTKSSGPPTWIGLKVNGFEWSDGSHYVGPYNNLCCVYTNDKKSRGIWNNGDCSNKLAYVCEMNE